MVLHWPAILVIFIALPSSLLGASHHKPLNNLSEQHENGLLGEPKSDCPEFCTCVRKANGGVIAKCVKITGSQQFGDRFSDWKLLADIKNEKEDITLEDGFFINLRMKNIQSITIVDIKIKSIDRNAFRGLHNLVFLNLTNNSLEKIHPDTFASNKNLRQLSLSGNSLSFEGTMNKPLNISSLQELDLSLCQLNTLENVFFSKLTSLAYLNLASNNLDEIDSDTFSNLTSLEELDLSNNNIHSLKGDLFIYNQALAHLTLRKNPLVTVENILIPGVTYLDLSYSKVTQISENSFNGVLSVSNLNLSHNVISEISVDAFSKLPKLAYLDLSDTSIDAPLDANLFVKNNQLETLSLKNNPSMKLLPDDGFKGSFDEFFKLNIANCGIENLSNGFLKNFPYLSQLDLSHNSLKTFEGNNILQPDLKHLNLAYNKITNSNDIQFPAKSQLLKLSLAGNKIKHLQSHFFDNLHSLTSLDLSNCEMEHIWENNQEEIHSLPNINTINLSGNYLQKITRQDLKVFSKLEMLNLNANPLVCDSELKDLADYLTEAQVGSFNTRLASEATSDSLSWHEFLHTLGCLPYAPTIKGARLSSHDSNESHDYGDDYGVIRCDFGNYDINEEEGNSEQEDNEENDHDDKRIRAHDQNEGKTAEQHVYGSSIQIIVMLVAAVTTFVVIVAFVVLIILCRSRLLLHRETMAKRHGHRLNIYKPLHDNEHLNSPTTPIMKTREVIGSNAVEVSTVPV